MFGEDPRGRKNSSSAAVAVLPVIFAIASESFGRHLQHEAMV